MDRHLVFLVKETERYGRKLMSSGKVEDEVVESVLRSEEWTGVKARATRKVVDYRMLASQQQGERQNEVLYGVVSSCDEDESGSDESYEVESESEDDEETIIEEEEFMNSSSSHDQGEGEEEDEIEILRNDALLNVDEVIQDLKRKGEMITTTTTTNNNTNNVEPLINDPTTDENNNKKPTRKRKVYEDDSDDSELVGVGDEAETN
jgi:hypothetical protein